MKLNGGVQLNESGLKIALRAMQVQTALMSNVSQNVNGFDKVGYQRREAVVSSFTEFLGIDGLSSVVDDKVGRLTMTQNPLDLAMATKGYFQIQTPEGIRLPFMSILNLPSRVILIPSGVCIWKYPFVAIAKSKGF